MLIWLEGGLNPNQINEKALKNGGDLAFQKKLLEFLDDTISNSIPPDPDPSFETELGKFDTCATRGPTPSDRRENPSLSRDKDLHKLIKRCQSHTHHPTCFKYWRGEPEPKECRFDLDEANVVPISMIDPETGELTLRCLDGLVNNFNSTMIEAIRCNMDIKFIGSGPAAKAILYYITDYITKTQLQAHVAYAALELAVGKLGEYDPEIDEITTRAKRLLQKCAHSMIAKQELSAQQVVSYLMDFEDHFTSHKFKNLYWTGFENFINDEDPSPECYRTVTEDCMPHELESALMLNPEMEPESETNEAKDHNSEDLDSETRVVSNPDSAEDEITLVFGPSGKVLPPSANQTTDYQNRGTLLEHVSVWDFTARVEKVSKAAGKRKHRTLNGSDDLEEELEHQPDCDDDLAPVTTPDALEETLEDYEGNILAYSGRVRPKVELKDSHVETSTHFLRVCTPITRKIPVPMGPAMPRRDMDDLTQKHARLMLILFKPWRHARDLRNERESWKDAYLRFREVCSEFVLEAIDNIQLLHECKDSRDAHFSNRQNRKRAGINRDIQRRAANSEDAMYAEEDELLVLDHLERIAGARSNYLATAASQIADTMLAAELSGMFNVNGNAESTNISVNESGGAHTMVQESHPVTEQNWEKAYQVRKDRWKRAASSETTLTSTLHATPVNSTHNSVLLSDGSAFRAAETDHAFQEVMGVHSMGQLSPTTALPVPATVDEVIAEYTLNTEQARAFRIIAEDSLDRRGSPLRMFLGGPGGTGKSRVINGLTDFFKQRGQGRRFRLASYTGVAARNISGMTLHAALSLNLLSTDGGMSVKARRDLMAMWEGVDYLFIDEVSMIGCGLLSDISEALSIAKGNTDSFGGISVIFAGDFSQLPPVGQTRLYSQLIKPGMTAATRPKQKVVFGKLLWLTFRTVVLLTENKRQSGPENARFLALLGRLREGRCTDSDYEYQAALECRC
ncbi:ATP-dependent DNA helicase [Mycena venus]|uniref:ATP-dependent DNA helicase n=1 Tax=Mycena venus TaxID=2733690 RepID=A0A8H6U416_9AGAR|nr:ATP-dependent DNA helicase [Mycena venus]